MNTAEISSTSGYTDTDDRHYSFDLRVRGTVPPELAGSLIVPTNRRHKNRAFFSRWHDSQTDLMRLDLSPGRPGRIRAHVLAVDPSAADVGADVTSSEHLPQLTGLRPGSVYVTQPNHGINIADETMWATNLLYGAPLEVDIPSWKPVRALDFLQLSAHAPRISGTSHFAWSLDHLKAYFHQSHLEPGVDGGAVRATGLRLFELDVSTGRERSWELIAPPEDAAPEVANFHSAFYYEENGQRFVGLLRTGAVIEDLLPASYAGPRPVIPAPISTIWIVELRDDQQWLQASLLPGIDELDGLALSHLDVDASGGDGFVLYANFKEADVAEETQGPNIYGEPPDAVAEHYSGMIVEAMNYGLVFRYERRRGQTRIVRFSRPYDPRHTSLGHSWLPINIQLDTRRERLFCSFSGFRPRLLPEHVARAYPGRVVDPDTIRAVPPALIRFNAQTLEPDTNGADRSHISYAEPMAMTVAGDGENDYVCTFSPAIGLRIYPAGDLTRMICHAESPSLGHWRDSHFRPEPAHLCFVPR
jgi:hypothetical protein